LGTVGRNDAREPGQHLFATMDGVRGIAAICVMVGHFGFPLYGSVVLFPSSYFAVDIFFCLSGFVICYSYADRLQAGLSAIDFMKLRLIRLYPLYILGFALGSCHLFLEYWFGTVDNKAYDVLMVLSLGLLFLPWGGAFDNGRDGGQNDLAMFPLNMPSWSLTFELFACLCYALFRPRGAMLFIVLILSLSMLALCAPPTSVAIQFPRVVFCFYLGAAICGFWRNGGLHVPNCAAILAPALALLLCSIPMSGLGYMVALTTGVPLVVSLSVTTPLSIFLRRSFLLLGELSYPLYVLHMPAFSVMRLMENWLTGANLRTEPSQVAKSLLAIGLLPVSVLLARRIDVPLRRKLTSIMFRAGPSRIPTAHGTPRAI
jgi:peptidoglycan/LPS O-acetylase OafA/YrhL